jgi:phosphoenolpyruvate carboxykinase (ATP)
MKLDYTRAIVHSVLKGELDKVTFERDAVFGLDIPLSCPGVPGEVLSPRNTWADKGAYDRQALKLRAMFEQNYHQVLSGQASAAGG